MCSPPNVGNMVFLSTVPQTQGWSSRIIVLFIWPYNQKGSCLLKKIVLVKILDQRNSVNFFPKAKTCQSCHAFQLLLQNFCEVVEIDDFHPNQGLRREIVFIVQTTWGFKEQIKYIKSYVPRFSRTFLNWICSTDCEFLCTVFKK